MIRTFLFMQNNFAVVTQSATDTMAKLLNVAGNKI